MKYLLLALVVLVGLWVLRRAAQRQRRVPPPPPPPAAIEDIVRCEVCGLNLPRSEALPGRGGHFCGDAHRREFEQRGGS